MNQYTKIFIDENPNENKACDTAAKSFGPQGINISISKQIELLQKSCAM